MNLVKTRLPRLLLSIVTVVATVAGLVLIGILPALNVAGGPVTLGDYISQIMYLIKNASTIEPSTISLYVSSMANIIIYLVTYIVALVFLIKCIVSLSRFNKEGSSKRITFDSLKLSFTLLIFFGFTVFFNYRSIAVSIALGGYLGLALGSGAVLFALINYFLVSERLLLSKCLRVCFVLVAMAASIFVLLPTLTAGESTLASGALFFDVLNGAISGGTVDSLVLSSVLTTLVFSIVAYAFVSNEGIKSTDERRKNDGRSVASIVLTAIALVLTLGALFGGKLISSTSNLGVSLYGILAIVLMGLALVLSILIFVFTKKEPVKVTPIEFTHSNEEEVSNVEEEPAEEVNEASEEEENTPEVEEVSETPVVEEFTAVEEVSTPAEEETKEETPKAEKLTKEKKEKPAPKKKAPAKKIEEKKEENKDAKKNASYHISKRASDNKWQVFRAGSEKVIKLFDTKVEAEEYTKRMAENQGVGYLSHASKGKNKGRIQKK